MGTRSCHHRAPPGLTGTLSDAAFGSWVGVSRFWPSAVVALIGKLHQDEG